MTRTSMLMAVARSAVLLLVALKKMNPAILSLRQLRKKYRMIGLKKTIFLIFLTLSRHLGEGLLRLTTTSAMTMTKIIIKKSIDPSRSVGPKLSSGLVAPSLS